MASLREKLNLGFVPRITAMTLRPWTISHLQALLIVTLWLPLRRWNLSAIAAVT